MSRLPVPAALCLALCIALPSPARADDPSSPTSPSWATAQAAARTRLGRDHAARGDGDAALRAFLDAIAFDATYGPAYLALGALYEARGDAREAERAFSMGLDHVAGFPEALLARGKLRAHLRRTADALADLEAAAALAPESPEILREVTDAYIAAGALPAALALARRRLALAEAQGDTRAERDARGEARALAGLVGELDPVSAGATGRGAVRRALWAFTRRR